MASHWALAANPKFYRVQDAISEVSIDWWSTGGSPLTAGDLVAIWKYKGRESTRGVVEFGLVVGKPEVNQKDDSQYWTEEGRIERAKPMTRVQVR